MDIIPANPDAAYMQNTWTPTPQTPWTPEQYKQYREQVLPGAAVGAQDALLWYYNNILDPASRTNKAAQAVKIFGKDVFNAFRNKGTYDPQAKIDREWDKIDIEHNKANQLMSRDLKNYNKEQLKYNPDNKAHQAYRTIANNLVHLGVGVAIPGAPISAKTKAGAVAGSLLAPFTDDFAGVVSYNVANNMMQPKEHTPIKLSRPLRPSNLRDTVSYLNELYKERGKNLPDEHIQWWTK